MPEPEYILVSERLCLSMFTLQDTKFIIELVNTPAWIKYIGDRHVHTQQDAVRYLQEGPISSYHTVGYGLSRVSLKETGESIGMCGIHKRRELNTPEIGFALLPGFCGKGYACEIASATLHYGLHILQQPMITAITTCGNSKSIRVLEKIGMHFEHKVSLKSGDFLFYLT